MTKRRGLVACAALFALSACAGARGPLVTDAAVPTSAPADLVLQPGDILRVTVWPEQGLSGEFVVEETGYVYLPYLDRVQAAGVSISQLRVQLRAGYSEMMQNPVVTITPLFRVSLTGEVQRPGIYDITPAYSLFDLIGEAGGFRPTANQEAVRIIRPGSIMEYDALRALETAEGLDAVRLRSGDQVFVPEARGVPWRSMLDVLQGISWIVVVVDRMTR